MRTAFLMLLTVYMLSCHKERGVLPQVYIELQMNGKKQDYIWEEVNGIWDGVNGSAYIDCLWDQYEQFSLFLPDVRQTGIVTNLGKHNISYSNDMGFRTGNISHAMVEVKHRSPHQIAGSFQAVLICEGDVDYKVQMAGDFIISTPH